MKQQPKQLERRYYDPGVTPMPTNPQPKAKAKRAKSKKKRLTLFDRGRLWAAKEKRERKAAKRREKRA